MHYTSKRSCELLNKKTSLIKNILEKWAPIPPSSFRIRWKHVWRPNQAKKNSRCLWPIIHKVVIVNVWKAKTNCRIDVMCPISNLGTLESLIHQFYDYSQAKTTWSWAMTIIYWFENPLANISRMKVLNLQKCIFNKKNVENISITQCMVVIKWGRMESNIWQRLNKVECRWLVNWWDENISLVDDSNHFWRE
jgi:hypothetical protein